MKILLAGQAFYQHNNGQAVFTINLAEGLAEKVETPARPNTIQHYLDWYRQMHHIDKVAPHLQSATAVGLP